MTPAAQVRNAGRSEATRLAILDAAERLFAEQGLDGVSHRQISSAAGQGNNAAVGYHFGTTADLVAAIVERHSQEVDAVRAAMAARIEGSTDIRDWVGCLVRPTAEHLEQLGSPTWWARLSAQLAADPRRHALFVERAMRSEPLRRTVAGFKACLPDLPEPVRLERGAMARLLTVHVFAERETALAGLWTAPVSP